MKLVHWLLETKIMVKELANLLSVGRTYLYLIRRGQKKPSKRVVRRVFQMSLGNVSTLDDFRDEVCIGHKNQKRLNETKASLTSHPLGE